MWAEAMAVLELTGAIDRVGPGFRLVHPPEATLQALGLASIAQQHGDRFILAGRPSQMRSWLRL